MLLLSEELRRINAWHLHQIEAWKDRCKWDIDNKATWFTNGKIALSNKVLQSWKRAYENLPGIAKYS